MVGPAPGRTRGGGERLSSELLLSYRAVASVVLESSAAQRVPGFCAKHNSLAPSKTLGKQARRKLHAKEAHVSAGDAYTYIPDHLFVGASAAVAAGTYSALQNAEHRETSHHKAAMRAPRIAATHQECKVVKVSMAAMALWFLLVVFARESNKPMPQEAMPSRANEYCSAPLTSGDEGGSDVTSVTVVVRHGARSGIATEVQDWKCGLGALKSHIKRWEAASGNALTPETASGTCKKGQLVARGFRQHKRLGAFLRSRYGPVWKSKFFGAFVLNHRVAPHAIDATPARWRGDAGSSPLDRARTAASSPRNDLGKNCRVPG